jgi:hypothetical protein
MRRICLLAATVLVAACSSGEAAEVQGLKAELASARQKADSAYQLADSLRQALGIDDLLKNFDKIAVLDPAESGFGVVESSYGKLTFSIANVEPLADGSRVTLKVGNLTSATIAGGTLQVQWGPRQAKDQGLTAWQQSLHQSDMSFTEALAPGTWNNVRLTLGGTPPTSLGYLRVSIKDLPTIRMHTP